MDLTLTRLTGKEKKRQLLCADFDVILVCESFLYLFFLKDVVNSHTGLAFLKEASDFHSRYITTVRNTSNCVFF